MLKDTNEKDASRLSGKSLLLIAAATIVVRVAVMIVLRSWEFDDEFSFGYEVGWLGRWLAQGQGFSLDGETPSAKFPPLYPLLVGAFFYVFGVYAKGAAIGLFLFQSACSAVAAVSLAILGNHLFGRTAGLIAGFAWAFYPGSIVYSVINIWYSELAVMLVLLAIIIAVTTNDFPTIGRVAFLGGLSGLIVLVDSTMSFYLPLLLLGTLFARKVKLSRLVVLVIVWGITAGVMVSPWMVRNSLVLGSPRLVKSNAGEALFTGNNPFSSGANDRAEIRQAFAALDQEELEYYKSQSEIVYYNYVRNKALEWIRAHPMQFLHLTALRISYFWVWIPKGGWKSWVHLAYFSPLVILGVYGLWLNRRRGWDLAPVWLFLVVYPLPYYVTFLRHGRYSYPVEPLVLLLAAVPLAIWFGKSTGVTNNFRRLTRFCVGDDRPPRQEGSEPV